MDRSAKNPLLPPSKPVKHLQAGHPGRRLRNLLLLFLVVGISSLAILVLLLIDTEPMLAGDAELSPFATRHLYQLASLHNPLSLDEGEEGMVRLTQEDLDAAQEALSFTYQRIRLKTFIVDDHLLLQTSLRLTENAFPLYVNLVIYCTLVITPEAQKIHLKEVSVGDVALPVRFLQPLLSALLPRFMDHPAISPLFKMVRRVTVARHQIEIQYTNPGPSLELPLIGAGQNSRITPQERLEIERIFLELAKISLLGENNLNHLIRMTYQLSGKGGPDQKTASETNRIALLVLGFYFGNPLVAHQVDRTGVMKPYFDKIKPYRNHFKIHDRHDWVLHFVHTSVLTLLVNQEFAREIGTSKEIIDLNGSGFSFEDLLADRAGEYFALLTTQNGDHSKEIQRELASHGWIEDYFPSPANLPDVFDSLRFSKELGGQNSSKYKALLHTIDQMIFSAPGYKNRNIVLESLRK